jgi:hypothetical protein
MTKLLTALLCGKAVSVLMPFLFMVNSIVASKSDSE